MRILVVEDDARVASFIRRGLREAQYVVDLATDGEQGLYMAQEGDYDLIVLDVLLPKKNGFEVVKSLRDQSNTVPVLILTAREGMKDKVAGLDSGADDYLTKPFGFEELLARVRALLRRRGYEVQTVLKAGDLELDTLRRKAMRGGKQLTLTNREYGLLEFLLRRPNQVVTRTMLAEHVWEQDFDPFSNVIDVHIARLRRKIDDSFEPKLLQTVRGSGYMLQVPQSLEQPNLTAQGQGPAQESGAAVHKAPAEPTGAEG
ncbi:MAG: response regulator [Candidatus Eisenbacteria bacterium]